MLDELYWINKPIQQKKLINEIQGIAALIIYDGKIDNNEVEFLEKWILANAEYLDIFPLTNLKEMFTKIMTDGIADTNERIELLNFLDSIADKPDDNSPTIEAIYSKDTNIIIKNKEYCITGDLLYGERDALYNKITNLGGIKSNSVKMKTDYLIVGSLGSQYFKYGGYGAKVELAIRFNKEKKGNIKIISEKTFTNYIINI
jgi:NAD-dependent DNA ligase